MKKNIVKIITFVAGLYFLMEFMLPAGPVWFCHLEGWMAGIHIKLGGPNGFVSPLFNGIDRFLLWCGGYTNPLTPHYSTVNNFLMVLGAMAFYLGPINLTRGELSQVVRVKKGWYESFLYLVALFVGLMAAGFRSDTPNTDFTRYMSLTYDAVFYGIGLAFYITSMGLVSFYLVSAAHRAFLLNSLESGLMMVAASIVMLGLTPAGDYLNQFFPDSLQLGAIGQWILSTPNTAVQKAVLFGAAGGAFAAAMRNWLSVGKRGE